VDLNPEDRITKVEQLKAHVESIPCNEDDSHHPIDVVLGLLKSAGYSGKGDDDGGSHDTNRDQNNDAIGDEVDLLDHHKGFSSSSSIGHLQEEVTTSRPERTDNDRLEVDRIPSAHSETDTRWT
jgi:hypothetical protein